jgi:hypothetical protein
MNSEGPARAHHHPAIASRTGRINLVNTRNTAKMQYMCMKCHAEFNSDVVSCEKCGAFSISPMPDDVARQLFQEEFKSPCTKCGDIYTGTATLIYRRSAKAVFITGFALSVLFAMAEVIIWTLILHRGIPLILFFLIASLPLAICFPIGMNMDKHRRFICRKCGAENIK